MANPNSPVHTQFAVHTDNGQVLQFVVSGAQETIRSYVMIALKSVDEVVEVFDIYQNTTLLPVRKIAWVEFGRVA